MWKHNIKLAFRNFKRNKTSFLINLIGLSTGLACALLIYLWVNDEINIDKFHDKNDRLFQVLQARQFPQKIATWEITPILLANALEQDLPEIEAATNISSREESPKGVFSFDDKSVIAEGLYASENFFEVFTFPIKKSDGQSFLKDKNNIAISEKFARDLFSTTENVIGKTIKCKRYQEEKLFRIAAVFETPPSNSTLQFDFVWNMQLLVDADEYAGKWNGDYAKTFFVLKPEIDAEKFNNRLAPFMNTKTDERKKSRLFAQRFSDKYLNGKYENGKIAGGRISYVWLFSIIAAFILLIACINFINLSTAQASTKMKEIGVKKTIGANRQSLIQQFLSESILMSFLSLLIALLLVLMIMPSFNDITSKALKFNWSFNFVITLFLITLFTGLVSGSYSAFYLSQFKPSEVLKGKRIISFGEQWIRKGLVVFQFGLSIIFIVGVLVVQQQMEFIQTQNLGYQRDNVLSFKRPNTAKSETFITEVKNVSGVLNAGRMWGDLQSGRGTQGGYSWRGQEDDKKYSFKSPIIGPDVIETMDIELLAGRTPSLEHQEDFNKIIINESARKMMQLDNPVGMNIGYGDTLREIIGVVNDFNYGSIHHKIEPLIFRVTTRGNNILVKIKSGEEKTAIVKLEEVFQKFHPAFPFEYSFVDDDYQALYEAESRVATLSKYFSGLAIVISCLGLFGLAMFTAERRKKEIGIRKVLGSSIFGIVRMLTSDFTKTVFIAILISLPISFLIAKSWMANFAYGIELSWWLFLVPSLMVLFVAWCTVGMQTIKAASVNPVESLKDE
ncbi:MAG: FtsX-like permease family protein [Saprospiraceae bacterium]